MACTHQNYSGDQTKNEMVGACSMDTGGKECIESFGGKA